MENNGIQKINVHLKVMLIEGVLHGESTNIVMTGTQNFTNNAIWNNNEISLLFYNHNFFETYKQYFEILKGLPGIEIPQ
jgi:phosphatidylserine/phosphatidylglycerophosphate/cardiolipin synthase-like enzyme